MYYLKKDQTLPVLPLKHINIMVCYVSNVNVPVKGTIVKFTTLTLG